MSDMVAKVAEAIENARCPYREGPYGGYDYGHNNPTPPENGRYVVRDFRDPNSGTWGAWVHQTNDRAEHEAAFERLTREHVARAAIEEIREPTEAMVIIGGRIAAGLSSGRAIQPYEDDAANIWSAMIDAALADASLDGEK